MAIIASVLVATITLIAVAVSVGMIWDQWRFRSHRGVDRSSFLDHFERLGVAPQIAGAVYDYYTSIAVWRTFQISPDDDIDEVFGQAPEELESTLDAILDELKLSLPPSSVMFEQDRKHSTVSDVVKLVAWIANHQIAADR